ncbi:hypothetical protein JTE90_012448 [Oedothorax gibbosus]|uniref:Uncharacterized protein n=1 Tax=Oedothorax gibbosus TaxID=931172 RepID=A0AAV6U259_9ARAC|nr:hypothetical protein JTE90_012448 [Oedothorax gibbosus]
METLQDPFRSLLDDLTQDFLKLKTFCLQQEEYSRKIDAAENKRWRQILDRITGKDTLVGSAKPEPYRETLSDSISRKLGLLSTHYYDLWRRYERAQRRIAEQRVKCQHQRQLGLIEHGEADTLIASDETEPTHITNKGKEKTSQPIPIEISAEIDKHLGLKFLQSELDGVPIQRKKKSEPLRDGNRLNRCQHKNSPQSQEKSLEEVEAEEADGKMVIIALLKEIEERDNLIGMLKFQLQVKEKELFYHSQVE